MRFFSGWSLRTNSSDNGPPYKPLVQADREMAAARPYLNKEFSTTSLNGNGEGEALDSVFFSSKTVWVQEGRDDHAEIDVLRTGSCESRATVSYATEDDTALSGIKYVKSEGIVVFAPGEVLKTVKINIIDDALYDGNVMFKVLLEQPEECTLGVRREAFVKIVDDDLFPTVRGGEAAHKVGPEGRDAMFRLLVEYLRRNYHVPGVRMRTGLCMMVDAIENIYFIIKISSMQYMVDILFFEGDALEDMLFQKSRVKTAVMIAALFVFPFGLLHVVDLMKQKANLAGVSVAFLQKRLHAKFLDLDHASRVRVSKSTLGRMVVEDTVEIAVNGYMHFLHMMRVGGRFLLLFGFILFYEPSNAFSVLTFPIAAIFVGHSYFSKVARHTHSKAEQKDELVTIVHDTADAFRSLKESHQESTMINRLQNRIARLQRLQARGNMSRLNTTRVFPWLSCIIAAIYIVVNSTGVLCSQGGFCGGQGSVGKIMTMIQILIDLGNEFSEAFKYMTELMDAVGTLKDFTTVMNLPTDTGKARTNGRENQREMRSLMDEWKPGNLSIKEYLDDIPIQLHRVSTGGKTPQAFQSDHIDIPQGSAVSISEASRDHKVALLRLLSHSDFPDTGYVFLPSHLVVVNVFRDPVMLSGTLYYNLTFGVVEVDLPRLIRVLNRLHMSKVIDHLNEELVDAAGGKQHTLEDWDVRYTKHDQFFINFARALNANPNVLIVNEPWTHCEPDKHEVVLDALEEFVRNRGFEMHGPRELRYRTTLFTSWRHHEAAANLRDLELSIRGGRLSVVGGHGSTAKGAVSASPQAPQAGSASGSEVDYDEQLPNAPDTARRSCCG